MIHVGTSGYNYPEWKGRFYPPDLPASRMLPYYASQFATVEINYTFYRMPTEKLLAGWAAQVPERVHLRPEGAQAHHPRQAAEGLRGSRVGLLPRRRDAGRRASGRCCSSCPRT